jgi:hypothetical protein
MNRDSPAGGNAADALAEARRVCAAKACDPPQVGTGLLSALVGANQGRRQVRG